MIRMIYTPGGTPTSSSGDPNPNPNYYIYKYDTNDIYTRWDIDFDLWCTVTPSTISTYSTYPCLVYFHHSIPIPTPNPNPNPHELTTCTTMRRCNDVDCIDALGLTNPCSMVPEMLPSDDPCLRRVQVSE